MTVRAERELVSALDLRQARRSLIQGNLFPSSVARVAAHDLDQLSESLAGALQTGYRALPAEVVQVPKLDRSTRPALDLAVEDQVVYGAVVDTIRAQLYPGMVTFTGESEEGQTYQDFEQFPLTADDAAYVLQADVASFYEYVDHEKLQDQVIALVGSAELSDLMGSLLRGWMARPFGLPQGPAPSATLADIYISEAARTLGRAGFRFSRYSDDFRVVATTWPDARRAQLVLERALRDMGLVIAPRKLITPRIATYRGFLASLDDPRLPSPQLNSMAAALLAGEYPGADSHPGPEEVSDAERLLTELVESSGATVVSSRLARRAIRRLSGTGSDAPVSVLTELLSIYPHLSSTIGWFLVHAAGTPVEPAALRAVAQWLSSDRFRYPWQIGWVLYGANHAYESDPALGRWASDALLTEALPWFVRGQVAIAAGRHGKLPDIADFFEIWERAPRSARPDFVAAVLLGSPPWLDLFVDGIRTSPLLSAVADLPVGSFREWL